MDSKKSSEVTDLLRAWGRGDQAARDVLAARVYDELRSIGRRYMKDEHARSTLQTTVLVNEVYLRLIDRENIEWRIEPSFFSICAQMMRQILIDAARARGAIKRGGGAVKVDIEIAARFVPDASASVLALHEAVESFAKIGPRQARVVELRYFGGLSVEKTTEVLKISERTVMRDWDFAKAWLTRELRR
jgi:RNA polymerase sigma factor (TIGR02999 family)